jgi:Ca2+-binding RTX toxin-like protein
MAEATALEQYLLELLNRARRDPAAEAARLGIALEDGLEPGTLSAEARAPVGFNPLLIDAARAHGAWMMEADTFTHTGEGGSDPGARMEAAGYVFSGAWRWGENIAMRTGTADAQTAELLHAQLFLSAGHRQNLLHEEYREAGLGLVEGAFDYGAPYGVWQSVSLTQDLARSGEGSLLLGVAYEDRDGDGFYDPGEGLGGLTVTVRDMLTGQSRTIAGWTEGGYQGAIGAGMFEVTFAGAALAGPVTLNLAKDAENAKLDLVTGTGAVPAAAGAATLSGTGGADTLAGREGTDRLLGHAGDDLLFGGVGNDSLSGGSGADTLAGGTGRDTLTAGSGDDVLIGGPGGDVLTGADGADLFVFLAIGDRGDRITDFDAAAGDRVDLCRMMPVAAGSDWASLSEGGYARLTEGTAGAVLWVDTNGGGDRWTSLVTFSGRTATDLGEAFLIA